MRGDFSNVYDTRNDAERAFWSSVDAKRKWGRRIPEHGLDLKCGHCTAGHRMPGRREWRWVGTFPNHHVEVDCQCGQTLVGGDLYKAWADHVREVRS